MNFLWVKEHIIDVVLDRFFEQLLAPVWLSFDFVVGHLSLSGLCVLLGAGFCLPQIYGLRDPKAFAALARRFSRSGVAGRVLMVLGTLWFLY